MIDRTAEARKLLRRSYDHVPDDTVSYFKELYGVAPRDLDDAYWVLTAYGRGVHIRSEQKRMRWAGSQHQEDWDTTLCGRFTFEDADAPYATAEVQWACISCLRIWKRREALL